MAIINCPACGTRISSVAKNCNSCDTVFSEDVDEEQQIRIAKNRRYIKLQKIQNYSFLCVVLFAAGAVIMYMGITDNNQLFSNIGRVSIALGFIGYVILRALLVIKRKSS